MIKTDISNGILDALFGKRTLAAGSVTLLSGTCYIGLGLSGSTPTVSGGNIIGFSEPSGGNYARKLIGISTQAGTQMMSSAANAEIKNGEQEIHFNECLAEDGWGEIGYLGVFTASSGGSPVLVGELVDAEGDPTTVTVAKNQVPLFRVNQLKALIE